MEMIENPLFKHNDAPEYLLSLAHGYQVSQVLFAALDLNIFTILSNGKKGIGELARIARCDKGSLQRLTHALIGLKLLKTSHGKLLNAEIASHYLVKGGKRYLGNFLHHSGNLWDFWEGLTTQLKRGKGKKPEKKHLDNYSHRLRDYLNAMGDLASLKACTIAKALLLRHYRKMLDVGCGPGTFALAFASQNPKLTCTLIDLEPTLVHTRRLINRSTYKERITVVPCNIVEQTLPGEGYDLIFISNILHIYSSNEVKRIMKKLWHAAATPATVVIHDYLVDEPACTPLPALLFDLTMLVGTPRGRCPTYEELAGMFKKLGAKDIRQIPIDLGSSLVMGEKR